MILLEFQVIKFPLVSTQIQHCFNVAFDVESTLTR